MGLGGLGGQDDAIASKMCVNTRLTSTVQIFIDISAQGSLAVPTAMCCLIMASYQIYAFSHLGVCSWMMEQKGSIICCGSLIFSRCHNDQNHHEPPDISLGGGFIFFLNSDPYLGYDQI